MSDSTADLAHGDGRRDPGPRRDQDQAPRHTTELREPAGPDPVAGAPGRDPGAPRPIGVERTSTGNAEVDGTLGRLSDADHLPADGHIEVYEDVHSGLRDALTALDTRPGPQGPQGPLPPPAAPLAYNHRS